MSSAGNSAVAASKKRRNKTAEDIKRLILKSGLKPGDPVPTETELCQRLGVSRTSVREAIRTLATLDIVEVRHGHGTVVGEMSLDPLVETLVFRGVILPGNELSALRDVVDLRLALDLALAGRVVAAYSAHGNPALETLVQRMEAAADAGKTFLCEDRQFHSELLGLIDNRLATQLVTAFWDIHAAVAPSLGVVPLSDIRRTARAHRGLLEGVKANDVAGYRAAIVDHYEPLIRAIELASGNAQAEGGATDTDTDTDTARPAGARRNQPA